MHYIGDKREIERRGEVIVTQGQTCVFEEDEEGVPVLVVAAGKLIPDNWVGKRVRVTVKLEDE